MARLQPRPQHTPPHRTPGQVVQEPGLGALMNTHTPQHLAQEWRGAAETRAQAHTSTPHTRAGNGGVQAEHAHNHARPKTPTKNAGKRAKTQGKQQAAQTAAGKGRAKPQPVPKHTHPSPQSGVAGRSRHPSPSTTQTQAQAPGNSRKPSVHSPDTEAARAMQVTRPKEIRSPGVRLHPKACAALGLEAERATPKRLGTPVQRTCMHALRTGYARKSGDPLVMHMWPCARMQVHFHR